MYMNNRAVETLARGNLDDAYWWARAAILEDPHFIDREVIADYPDPDMGAFPMHHVVPRLQGTPGSIRTAAPKLGQHNRELLREAGVDEAAYAQLLRGGVVYEGEAAPATEDE